MSLQADFLVFCCFLMNMGAIKLRKSCVLTGGKFRELSPWLSRRQFCRCHEAHRLGGASAALEKEGNCVFGGGQPCRPRCLRSFGRAIPPTGEAEKGAARLMDLPGDLPEALSTYLSLVREGGPIRFASDRRSAAEAARPADGDRKASGRICGLKGGIVAFPQCCRGTGRRL